MEGEKFLCPNCGMPVEASQLNFKTRRAHCVWCDRDIIFPKKNSTASPSAVHALNEAYKFFIDKNFSSAKSCAETVVSMVPGNAPSLYIIAYYNAFISDVKDRSSLDHLFNVTLPDAEFEIEEEELFKDLLKKTILHAATYEEQIICKFAEYDDPKELESFVDDFCPFTIAKRSDLSWFTPGLCEAYLSITKRASIPKTWFALLQALIGNPESPLKNGQFFLKTKTANIYNNFVVPLGEIFKSIPNPDLRVKFLTNYTKFRSVYESKMRED